MRDAHSTEILSAVKRFTEPGRDSISYTLVKHISTMAAPKFDDP